MNDVEVSSVRANGVSFHYLAMGRDPLLGAIARGKTHDPAWPRLGRARGLGIWTRLPS